MKNYKHIPMADLDTPIRNINRVGKATANKFEKLGIKTVKDMLFYFPFRYDDFSKNFTINELKAGVRSNVIARLILIQNRRARKRRMNVTEALFEDDTGELKAIWFNQPFIAKNLRIGDLISLSGKISADFSGKSMISPVYEKIIAGSSEAKAIHTQGLVPTYSATKGLTQKQIRFLASRSMPALSQLADWIPESIISENGLIGLRQAIKEVHFPSGWQQLKQARERLAFNELFLVQLRSQQYKKEATAKIAPRIGFKGQLVKEFVRNLPFELTIAQRKSAWQILKDMESPKPMSRLLIGDVGSGKTVVAAIAILNALAAGNLEGPASQAVLMAPTEILARQHFNTFLDLFKGFPFRIGLFTGGERIIAGAIDGQNKQASEQKATKKTFLASIAGGSLDFIIGTHALIQENVLFRRLVLAVIDEQHRFGVEQRHRLTAGSGLSSSREKQNDSSPHLLSMSATPIPRTLALAYFSDLDVSVINEMPKGRKTVITRLALEEKRDAAYKFIRERLAEGRQAYVICPLIDESDKVGLKSVLAEYDKLHNRVFSDMNIAYLHGKMKSAEKDRIMREFADNKINILVSTSVIEVGIDVPNATMMVIEGADRFGLAQLHQFRGRIGRGQHQSYCVLFSDNRSDKTQMRLKVLTEQHSGFELAKLDLKFRGPGEIFGIEQTGFPELKVATLFDHFLLQKAKQEAENLFTIDRSLSSWPELQQKLLEYLKEAHFE